ncbi:MAG: hypothetical protein JSR17_00410 [Proteobacteria bacterium]|nr:hypothetical protein [Pseudomonadota bacterium]
MAALGPYSVFIPHLTIPFSRSGLSAMVYGYIEYMSFLSQQWHLVTTEVNWVRNGEHRWVSLGSHPTLREKLFFDEHSMAIAELKHQALVLCQGKTIDQVLKIVCNIINNITRIPGEHVTQTEARIDFELNNFLRLIYTQQNSAPSLLLDDLIKLKLLVCRHKALISCALLRHLTENGILPNGSVRQYRTTLPNGGGHTFSVYRDFSSGQLWICDPRNRVVGNLHEELIRLSQIYTLGVLSDMKLRLDEQDVFIPLQRKMRFSEVTFYISLIHNQHGSNQLTFNFLLNDHTLTSFAWALQRQNISFAQSCNILTINIDENPRLFSLNVNQLIIDFKNSEAAFMIHTVLNTNANTVLFAASNVSLASGSGFCFVNQDWEEFLAKDSLPKEHEFFTKNKTYGRFNYR